MADKVYDKICRLAQPPGARGRRDRARLRHADHQQAHLGDADCAGGRERRGRRLRGRGARHGPRRHRGGRQLHRRLLGARAQGHDDRRPGAPELDPRGAGHHRARVRVGERRHDERRHQHGRRGPARRDRLRHRRAHRRPRRHRLREAGGVLQRGGRQPVHGRRVSRHRRARVRDQRRRERAGRGVHGGEEGARRRLRRAGQHHQAHRVQGDAHGRAGRARGVGRSSAVPFGIVDLSLAPTPAQGDSVARILEAMGLERVGTHGSTAALALLNDAVKKGGAMASSYVGGLSGAFIPVSEDEGMIEAAPMGAIGSTSWRR